MTETTSLNTLARVARAALVAGGKALRASLKTGFTVRYKGRVDPVTSADHASERAVMSHIRRHCPTHGFLTEETGLVEKPSPYRWIIDPLDGTVNFSHGLPIYCISVAVARGEETLAGGVLDPTRDELFFAVKGRGATLNGQRLKVSGRGKLIESLLVTGFPYQRRGRIGLLMDMMKDLLMASQGVRRLGAAALDMAYVACGRFDAFWEYGLKPWDAAAGRLLIEEAGGRVTDFSGQRRGVDDTREILCSNGTLHPSLVRTLKKHLSAFRKVS